MTVKYGNCSYSTEPERKAPTWPTASFFFRMAFGPLCWLWRKARSGQCDDYAWAYSSVWLADIFEEAGGRIIVDGLENIANLDEPCVIIANHMSTLETFVLPAMIRPLRPVTFIVKKSLVRMPVFGPIMLSRNPVVVERANPRKDLETVLAEGVKRLENGISLVVFPQHTRSLMFDESIFNTIGVKLARKANAPVIPLALKTDAWGLGNKIKELGRVRPDLPARFRFGESMRITGNGRSEHGEICRFIGDTVGRWQNEDGINS